MIASELLFVEKYRPQTIDECILPEETLKTLQNIIETGIIPNLLFAGTAGIGKTTVAQALGRQMSYDVLFINASNEGRLIDTLRGVIIDFASTMSLYSNRKLVILDEFDGAPQLVQEALRAFVELYSSTCSFILTCNYKHKLIPAIHSRFAEINFNIPPEQRKKLSIDFMKRIVEILKVQNIVYDSKAIVELVRKYFPDFRRTLNELQRYSSSGEFNLEHLKNIEVDISGMISLIRDKNFTEMIKVIEQSSSIDINSIATDLWDNCDKYVNPKSKASLIDILETYIDKATRTTNPKITVMAMFAQLMANVDTI